MTRRPRHALIAALVLLVLPCAALAQDAAAPPPAPAMLIADEVLVTDDNRLIAKGNVEALYDGNRLKAHEIVFDRTTERLTINGPIVLDDGNYTILLADSAELDRDLRNGIVTGARIVMDDQLQLASHQIDRVDGRYSQLYRAAVTSCRVCEEGRAPLWQIRARRVIHDQQAQQLYLHDAQFRVLDVPVFYFPRLRLPDPTLDRATGFLIPSLHNSTVLGFGVKVPYFIRIGDHRDLTLTPYISTETTTLEYRYRQAFRRGGIEVSGALTHDDIGARGNRAYFEARGVFDLERDFILRFDIEAVNDDTYLVDYDYSSKDRLDSEISIERTRRDEWMRAALTHFHTLRPGESNTTLPTIVGDATYERRFFPAQVGGELRFSAEAHRHFRSSDLTTDGPDTDGYADGRDVTRLTTTADWRRTWTLAGGLRAGAQTGVAVDHYEIAQAGVTSLGAATEVTPAVAVTLRWPLAKATKRGVAHVIEPMVQLAWVGGNTPDIPRDESTRTEFDEGNMLSLSRFPEGDRRERGTSLTYGLTWTRHDPGGIQSTLTFGQILRDKRQFEPNGAPAFSNSSGLQGQFSDVLVAGQIRMPFGLQLTARGLFDSAFDTTKAEARVAWHNDTVNLGATYIWLGADVAEDRPGTISEWAVDGSYRFARHWTGSAEWRYDVARDQPIRTGLGVTYTNECVDISLSASRRFTSSTILTPSTDISLTVGLRGFSARTEDKSYVRKCRKQIQ